uniref:ARAD1D34650p n=1 Tax=Blastobotrys adeninivorans TaxID=409370 RepID=A0A060THW9_BLAAD
MIVMDWHTDPTDPPGSSEFLPRDFADNSHLLAQPFIPIEDDQQQYQYQDQDQQSYHGPVHKPSLTKTETSDSPGPATPSFESYVDISPTPSNLSFDVPDIMDIYMTCGSPTFGNESTVGIMPPQSMSMPQYYTLTMNDPHGMVDPRSSCRLSEVNSSYQLPPDYSGYSNSGSNSSTGQSISSIPSAPPTVPTVSTQSTQSGPSANPDGTHDGERRKSESRISLPELYERMGLKHDHKEASKREQRVLSLLKSQGFRLGEQTWIRDTSEADRRAIIDYIHSQTYQEYGYSKQLIEVIIRRGSYYLMQGRLRRIRRATRRHQLQLQHQEQQQLQHKQPHQYSGSQPFHYPQPTFNHNWNRGNT